MEIAIPSGLSDAALLSLVVGFVAPLVLNFLVRADWASWKKALAAFAFSVVLGVLTALVVGAFDGLSIVSSILLVLVVSITTYQNFWKPLAPNLQASVGVGAADTKLLIVDPPHETPTYAPEHRDQN